MKSFFPLWFLLSVIVFFYNPAIAGETDTLPAYGGFRLHITGIEILKQSPKSVKLRCDLVNTGREYIALGPKNETRNVEVFFDESLSGQGLSSLEADLRKQVLLLPVAIQAGQIIRDKELEISLLSAEGLPEKPEKKAELISKGPEKEYIFADTLFRNYCPDLVIDTIRLIGVKKKWATLEFHIRNTGKSAARLTGPDKDNSDDVAVKAYLSGTKNLTKGSIPIGGMFAGKNLQGKESNLLPGDTYIDIIKLDISNKTKYTSIIILFADSFLLVAECDETNNAKSIQLH